MKSKKLICLSVHRVWQAGHTVIFLCVTSRTPLFFYVWQAGHRCCFLCDKQDTVIFYLWQAGHRYFYFFYFLCVTSRTPLFFLMWQAGHRYIFYFFMCDKQDTVIFLMCDKQDTVIFYFYFFMCDKQDTVIFLMCDKQDTVIFYLWQAGHRYLFFVTSRTPLFFMCDKQDTVIFCVTSRTPLFCFCFLCVTSRTPLFCFCFYGPFVFLYAWMPVLHGVRSDTQLWTLILQTPAFKQQGRKPFCELKVIRRGGCSFMNSVLRHLQCGAVKTSRTPLFFLMCDKQDTVVF